MHCHARRFDHVRQPSRALSKATGCREIAGDGDCSTGDGGGRAAWSNSRHDVDQSPPSRLKWKQTPNTVGQTQHEGGRRSAFARAKTFRRWAVTTILFSRHRDSGRGLARDLPRRRTPTQAGLAVGASGVALATWRNTVREAARIIAATLPQQETRCLYATPPQPDDQIGSRAEFMSFSLLPSGG
jgi:hypothetical protein